MNNGLRDRRKPMKETALMITVTREVLWESPDGVYVVIKGPFPDKLQRTLTANSVWAAARRNPTDPVEGIMARLETTQPDKYAKTLRALVIDPRNEYGEVAP